MNNDTRSIAFLWGMVAADIYRIPTYGRDYEARQLAGTIRDEIERPNDVMSFFYSELVVYTSNLTFKWEEDAPPELTILESWWKELKADRLRPGAAYLMLTEQLAGNVWDEWQAGRERAQAIWKPKYLRGPDELTAEDKKDPN